MANKPHRTPAEDASAVSRRVLDIGVAGVLGVCSAAVGAVWHPAAAQQAPQALMSADPGAAASADSRSGGAGVVAPPVASGVGAAAPDGAGEAADPAPGGSETGLPESASGMVTGGASPNAEQAAPARLGSLAPLLRLRLGVDDSQSLDVMTTGPPGGDAAAAPADGLPAPALPAPALPAPASDGAPSGIEAAPGGEIGDATASSLAEASGQAGAVAAGEASAQGATSQTLLPNAGTQPVAAAPAPGSVDGPGGTVRPDPTRGPVLTGSQGESGPGGAGSTAVAAVGDAAAPAAPVSAAPLLDGPLLDGPLLDAQKPAAPELPAPGLAASGLAAAITGVPAEETGAAPAASPPAAPPLPAPPAPSTAIPAMVEVAAAPVPASPPGALQEGPQPLGQVELSSVAAAPSASAQGSSASPDATDSGLSPGMDPGIPALPAASGSLPVEGAPKAAMANVSAAVPTVLAAAQAASAAEAPRQPEIPQPREAPLQHAPPLTDQGGHAAAETASGGDLQAAPAHQDPPALQALASSPPAGPAAPPAPPPPVGGQAPGGAPQATVHQAAGPALDDGNGPARQTPFRFGASARAQDGPTKPPAPKALSQVLAAIPLVGLGRAASGGGDPAGVGRAVRAADGALAGPLTAGGAGHVDAAASSPAPPQSAGPPKAVTDAGVTDPAARPEAAPPTAPMAAEPAMAPPPPGAPAASATPDGAGAPDAGPLAAPGPDQMADSSDASAIARSFAREALGEAGPDAPPASVDASGARSAEPAAAAGVTPPREADGVEPETLAGAILAAITGNPDILSAQARRDDARYALRQSRAALLPSLDLMMSEGLEGTRSDGSAIEQANRAEAQLALRQLIWDFGAVGNDVKRARAVYEGIDWALRNEVERVAFDVAAAYIGVLERQQLAALAQENVTAHERILETVQNQRQFGLVSGADVSRVEAKLNAARGALLDRRSDLAVAQEGFRRQLNRLPGPLSPAPLAAPLIPEDVEATLELAEKGNPELRQATALLESLRRQTASQRAGMLPRIELEAQGNWKDNVGGPAGRSDDARAMVTMRYKLYDGGAQSAAVSRAKARLRQAEFDFDRTRRDIVQLVRSDYAALAAARDKVAAIEQEVQAGERLVELYITQFRAGGRSVFDLLDSQETLIAGKSKRISNVAAREIAAYRVLKNIGELFMVATGEKFEAAQPR